jgi:trans-aconitate methyltransferase
LGDNSAEEIHEFIKPDAFFKRRYDVNFNEISDQYDEKSFIQKEASCRLFELLDIGNNEDVLDIGCGSGTLTASIRSMTGGKVTAIDASQGMINEAKNKFTDIDFRIMKADDMDFKQEFDVIFCNSTFQWFKTNYVKIISNFYKCLRKNGRVGIQAPATLNYCRNFVDAIDMVKTDERTKKIFAGFELPWLFLETKYDYRKLFEDAGFEVQYAAIEVQATRKTPEDIYKSFSSGAAAGYLNKDYYETEITEEYVKDFNEIMQDAFYKQSSKDGKADYVYNRIYLVARKK